MIYWKREIDTKRDWKREIDKYLEEIDWYTERARLTQRGRDFNRQKEGNWYIYRTDWLWDTKKEIDT